MLRRIADDFWAAGGRLHLIDADLGLIASLLGRDDEARARLDEVMRRASPLDYFTVMGDCLLSQLVVRVGEAAHAEDMYRRLEPYPHWVVPFHVFPMPSVSFHLGLLAGFLRRFSDAERHFFAAMAEQERMGAPTYLARTRLEWGRLLLDRGEPGDVAQAQTMLRDALAAAMELGLLSVERDATALLGG